MTARGAVNAETGLRWTSAAKAAQDTTTSAAAPKTLYISAVPGLAIPVAPSFFCCSPGKAGAGLRDQRLPHAVLAEKCCGNRHFAGREIGNSVIPFAMENLALIFRPGRNTVHFACRSLHDLCDPPLPASARRHMRPVHEWRH
jgi:hypothetical protein